MIKGIMTVDDSSISLRRPDIAPWGAGDEVLETVTQESKHQMPWQLLAMARMVLS